MSDARKPLHNDPQRGDEVSRQRAYGETPALKDTPLADQDTPHPGYLRDPASPTAPDRGMLRDDGQPMPDSEGDPALDRPTDAALVPTDQRYPNAPETAGADHGPRPASPARRPAVSNTNELSDAYSVPDVAPDEQKR